MSHNQSTSASSRIPGSPPQLQNNNGDGGSGPKEIKEAAPGSTHQISTPDAEVNQILRPRPGHLEIRDYETTDEDSDEIVTIAPANDDSDDELANLEEVFGQALVGRTRVLWHEEHGREQDPMDQAPPIPVVNPQEEDEIVPDIFKAVLNSEVRPLAKGSIALMTCAWIWLFFPKLVQYHTLLSFPCAVACSLLTCVAIKFIVTKPDLHAIGPFRGTELYLQQLFINNVLWYVMDILLTISHIPKTKFFAFPTMDSTKFKARVEEVRNYSVRDVINDGGDIWFRINGQFLLVSFSALLLINIPFTLLCKAYYNNLMRQVLVFELQATVTPSIHIVVPFILMNMLAAWLIPPNYQSSILLWGFLHILSIWWIGIILLGVIRYPEIPVVRPLGLPGYHYMMRVTLLQIVTDMLSYGVAMLGHNLYFQLSPGSLLESLTEPGFVMGPHLFFNQMIQGRDPATWEYNHPYPLSYDFIKGIFVIICIIREFKLLIFIEEIENRIEEGMQQRLNEMVAEGN